MKVWWGMIVASIASKSLCQIPPLAAPMPICSAASAATLQLQTRGPLMGLANKSATKNQAISIKAADADASHANITKCQDRRDFRLAWLFMACASIATIDWIETSTISPNVFFETSFATTLIPYSHTKSSNADRGKAPSPGQRLQQQRPICLPFPK